MSMEGRCATCVRSSERLLHDRTHRLYEAFVCEEPGGGFRRVQRFWHCGEYMREPGAEGDE